MTSQEYGRRTVNIRNRSERYITALMKRYFFTQLSDIKAKIEKGIDPLDDWQRWDRILFDWVDPRIQTIINVTRKNALDYMGEKPRPRDIEIVFKAGEVMSRLDKVNDTTRDLIEKTVSEAQKKSTGLALGQRATGDQLQSAINAIITLFNGFIASRSPVIGLTLATASTGAGVDMAVGEPEKRGRKIWRAFIDKDTRPGHEEADGQDVAEGEYFIVDDEKLRWPGDPYGSAGNIINCRCYIEPYTE
jgi:hypothetical protein